ncbi:MAG: DUF4111 domain-containing protein [Roseiflexaceae bacterium]|nr:DUF4111 domain-containing protein [Roseiflexaceae bacterium]
MSQFGWNTSPPAIRAQVERYVAEVHAILGDELIGVYLHGSLAMGCFNPAQSDLDLLVVTRVPMSLAKKRDVADHLLRISRQPAPIEVSFLTVAMLTPWRHPPPFDFHYSEMWRDAYARDLAGERWRTWNAGEQRDPDLSAHITVARQRGIALYGPPAAAVFPEVPEADYIAAIMSDVTEALDRIYADPVYAILNACRTLAFLHTRQVLSKDEGGRWAIEHLPPVLRPLIQLALTHYRDAENTGAFPATLLETFGNHARQELRRCLAANALATRTQGTCGDQR